MRTSVLGLTTCAVALSCAIAGCTFTPSAVSHARSPGPSAPATPTKAGKLSLAQVAAGSVDLVSEQGLQGTEAAGTGIVLTPDGEVLTNNHVISGATSLTAVDIGNGHSYTASVVGYDRSHDLALVQLHGASGLQTLSLAANTRVAVGEAVTALGNAGGRGGAPSTAAGSVTALNRRIVATDEFSGSSEQLSGLIQVDAPIEAGDSGGPLVDSSGQVIGIDTAASVGYRFQSAPVEGFAVPAARAKSVADAIAAGRASATVHIGATAWLGVAVGSPDAASAATSGAAIVQVVPDSPADRLGLVADDVVTSVDGVGVGDPNALTTLLDRHHPGDTVKVGWTDTSGQPQSADCPLGTGPAG
ncbi:S1C family serine protease [Streptacidiphilus rugosus]|uniref:S1C family serine protease n=1 Tax=Streptacidiphilus rugosus TaxID=405783 RepID=UPI00068E6A25|nr:trypsin-like peptidase domain-containing protein [Streptacidiphilus rugosus]